MSKVPLILLHGALGSSRYFEPYLEALSKNFDVHLLNFEGHANAPTDSPFSVDLFAQNLVAFINERGLNNVCVFGYSMGGYVALKVALTHPNLIGKIVTLGTKFNWSPTIAAKEIRMLNPELVEEKIPKFAANLKVLHAPHDWKIVMAKTALVMQLLGEGKGLKETDFESIQQDVIIGVGELDKMVTVDESEKVAAALPNGECEVLEKVVHPIEMIPQEVVLQFIHKHLLKQ